MAPRAIRGLDQDISTFAADLLTRQVIDHMHLIFIGCRTLNGGASTRQGEQ